MVKQTLLKGSHGHGYGAHCEWVLDWGKDTGLSSSFNRKREIYNQRARGVVSVDGKLPEANLKDRGLSAETDLTRLWLKAGPRDKLWRVGSYQRWEIFCSPDLAGFFL